MVNNICNVLLLVLFASYNVQCYPSGAGGCAGGKAAVGRPHQWRFFGLREVKSYSLTQKNIIVTLGGFPLSSAPTGFIQGVDYQIQVVGQNIKGLLFRVPGLKGDLLPGEQTKIARFCRNPVAGITHTNAATKNSLKGSIQFNESKSYEIDITVVFENGFFSKSEYAYGKVKITVA